MMLKVIAGEKRSLKEKMATSRYLKNCPPGWGTNKHPSVSILEVGFLWWKIITSIPGLLILTLCAIVKIPFLLIRYARKR